jgi:hypothetical protein
VVAVVIRIVIIIKFFMATAIRWQSIQMPVAIAGCLFVVVVVESTIC